MPFILIKGTCFIWPIVHQPARRLASSRTVIQFKPSDPIFDNVLTMKGNVLKMKKVPDRYVFVSAK
jgi:hypothetical protein